MTKTVVITRPEGISDGANELSAKVEALGLRPLRLSVLRCELLELSAAEEQLLRGFMAEGHGWVAFLSPNSVLAFRHVCDERLHGLVVPPSIKFAVQGGGTADALQSCFGHRPDFVPSVFVAEEFGEEFAREARQGGKVLVPQSAEGRDILAPLLRSKGFDVVSLDTYRTRQVPLSSEDRAAFERLEPGQSVLVFMSPSAVRATVRALADQRPLLEAIPIISVGPITTQAVKQAGLQVAFEATPHSEEGVIEALRTYFHL
jgi:uroporphyrinogen-III synthase